MWDQYLKILNRIWDLESAGPSLGPEGPAAGAEDDGPRSQGDPRVPTSHFKEVLWQENLLELNRSWQVELKPLPPLPKSWLGRLLFPLKKLMLRWVYAYLAPVLSDQREFNARTVRTFNNGVNRLDQELAVLIRKVEYQKDFNAGLIRCLNALVDYVDRAVLGDLKDELGRAQQTLEREIFGFKKQLDERTELFRQLLDERSLKTQQILDERFASLGQVVTEKMAYLNQILNERTAYIHQLIFERLSFGKETIPELRQKLESCLQGYYIQNRKLERVLSLLNVDGPTEDDSPGRPYKGDRLSAEIKEELAQYLREIEDHKYLQFENQFRGDSAEIKNRQAGYLPFFQQCRNVLDMGCGRGEFLELLRENQIGGYGIDTNGEMVAYCTQRGFKAETADALTHLSSLADNSLDGIFSAQVIEHLDPGSLVRLIKLCYDKLKPDAFIVLETINVSSVLPFVFFFVDLSHKTPLHPQTAEFLMKASGFTDVQIRYTSPVPDSAKLLTFQEPVEDPTLRSYLQLMNENMEKLNTLLFGYRDYAVIARKQP